MLMEKKKQETHTESPLIISWYTKYVFLFLKKHIILEIENIAVI